MTWKKLGWCALIVAVALAMPYTRRLVLLVLPLGSGFDDLVFIIALGTALFIFGGRWYQELKLDTFRATNGPEWKTTRRIGVVIIVIAIVAVAIMISMFASIIEPTVR